MLCVGCCVCYAEKLIMTGTAAVAPTLLVNADAGKNLFPYIFLP